MASVGSNTARGPRIRPISWFILAVCFILIVCILAAWRGSAAHYGRIPEVRFATDQWSVSAEPVYWDTPFERGGDARQLVRPLSAEQVLSVGLPGEFHRAPVSVIVTRQPASGEPVTDIHTYGPGEASTLSYPAQTPQGRLVEVVVSAGYVPVYDAQGGDSVLSGEWSVQLREVHKEGRRELSGAPQPEPLPDSVPVEVPAPQPETPAHGARMPNPHHS